MNTLPPVHRSADFVKLAAVFYAALGVLAVLVARWLDVPLPFADTRAREAGVDWGTAVAAGLVAAALVIAVSALLTEATAWGGRMADALASALGPLGIGQCLLLAGVSGIAEEALFRGVLQPLLGWVAASVLFGAAHFVPRRELAGWSLFAMAAGLLFGWLFEATGNLVAPIVAHAGINAVNLRMLARRSGAADG